ncbi:MAG TPA: hypothetical protein VFR81_26960 [Longimicrobium sp.]|nr:hypothetical protein [Longimicrobium sp.]
MKKLTLSLDALAVESFDVATAAEARGTVLGRETEDGVDGGATGAYTCANCPSEYWTCDPCNPEAEGEDVPRRIILY